LTQIRETVGRGREGNRSDNAREKTTRILRKKRVCKPAGKRKRNIKTKTNMPATTVKEGDSAILS